MKHKKILLINQGNSDNLGDKAINIVFKNMIEKNTGEVVFAGYSQCVEQNISSMSDRLKSKKNNFRRFIPPAIIWALKYKASITNEFHRISQVTNYDLIVIGGGQLIKTKNVFPYCLYHWTRLLNKKFNCPVLLVGIGVDDKFTFIEKKIYKEAFSRISELYVRDNNSINVLASEFALKSKFIPDVVFNYSSYYPETTIVDRDILLVMIYDYQEMKFNFGTRHSKNEYYKIWENLIYENNFSGAKIMLGYTTTGDKKETIEFAEHLKNNTDIEYKIVNTDDVLRYTKILSKSQKVISGRMHALIIGMNYDCEVIPYLVSSKLKTFKEEWIDSKKSIDKTREEIESCISDIFEKYLD